MIDGEVFSFNGVLRLDALRLALDPRRRERFAYVSHAHSDHTGRHDSGFATPATVALTRARLGECALQPLAFGEPLVCDDHTITLVPAGHVLGASQLVVDTADGTRFVYTGDFSVRPARIVPPAQPIPCDVLVMECTYGQPRYRFPDDEEVAEQVHRFIKRSLDEGATPVLLGYELGKAQEAIRLVNDLGYRVAAHPGVARLSEVYRACGVDCGSFEVYPDCALDGHVLIVPPRAWPWPPLGDRKVRTLYLTGWAVERRWRFGHLAVPLSDHADFGELLAFVEQARPRRVYTLHGSPDFAAELRAQGFVAEHLEPVRASSGRRRIPSV